MHSGILTSILLYYIIFFFCYAFGTVHSVCPISIPNTDGSHYKAFGKDCYYFSEVKKNDWSAMQDCTKGGGAFLVSILSKEENEFIRNEFVNTYSQPNDLVWVGLYHDTSVNQLLWDDGSPVDFLNFQTKQHFDTNYHCVVMDTKTGYWERYRCTSTFFNYPQLSFVCKFKGKTPISKLVTTQTPINT